MGTGVPLGVLRFFTCQLFGLPLGYPWVAFGYRLELF